MTTQIGQDIHYAAQLLNEGAAIAIPTETVYGLAANALNNDAVLKIFEAKNRPYFNPLIVHTYSWENALKYVQNVPQTAHVLAAQFCPGPTHFFTRKKRYNTRFSDCRKPFGSDTSSATSNGN